MRDARSHRPARGGDEALPGNYPGCPEIFIPEILSRSGTSVPGRSFHGPPPWVVRRILPRVPGQLPGPDIGRHPPAHRRRRIRRTPFTGSWYSWRRDRVRDGLRADRRACPAGWAAGRAVEGSRLGSLDVRIAACATKLDYPGGHRDLPSGSHSGARARSSAKGETYRLTMWRAPISAGLMVTAKCPGRLPNSCLIPPNTLTPRRDGCANTSMN